MIFYFLISQPKHVGYQTTCFGTKDIAHNCMFRPKKKIGVFTVCRPTLFYSCRPYHFFSENKKKNETVFRSCFSGLGF